MAKEIELKFRLANPEQLASYLIESGFREVADTNQVDVYYDHNNTSFLEKKPIVNWLRLRRSPNGKQTVNFKEWIYPEDSDRATACDEYETSIGDYNVLANILLKLGHQELVRVDKHRRSYSNDTVEISIDVVKGLGSFIELEYQGGEQSIEKATQCLYELLKDIPAEIGDQDYLGYPFHMLKLNGKEF